MTYKVSWKGLYLFHCTGSDLEDAMTEAQTLAYRQGRKREVMYGLTVERDNI